MIFKADGMEMKKYVAQVHRRKSAFSNEWHREKDIVIYARNEVSACNKLDKIRSRILSYNRGVINDYVRIDSYVTEVKDD